MKEEARRGQNAYIGVQKHGSGITYTITSNQTKNSEYREAVRLKTRMEAEISVNENQKLCLRTLSIKSRKLT